MAWQLNISDPATGYIQMTLDNCLFEWADQKVSSFSFPLVRFYSFSEPSLSLGWTQEEGKKGVPSLEVFRQKGWEVIRRPTGGGIVVHLPGDFIYSVIAPLKNSKYPNTLMGSYSFFGEAIGEGLKNLGLPCERPKFLPRREEPALKSPFCFSEKESHEWSLQGKKIFGSAQRRGQFAFLQQGILPLSKRSLPKFPWISKEAPKIAKWIEEMSPLETFLPKKPSFSELSQIFEKAFEKILGSHKVKGTEQLDYTKYAEGGPFNGV